MKKKLLSMLLVGAMAVSLVACGGNDENAPENREGGEDRAEMLAEAEENTIENDGYEIVDKINIDSDDTKLSFVKTDKMTLQGGEDVLVCYFNFENVNAGETSVDAQYNFMAYQDGVEITVYSTVWDEIEAFENRDKTLLDGGSVEFAIAIEPSSWDKPIQLRVDDEMLYDEEEKLYQFQEQEILLN